LLIGVVLTLKGVNIVHGAVILIVFLSHIGVASTEELIVKLVVDVITLFFYLFYLVVKYREKRRKKDENLKT
jgi:hypothetical protein